MALKLGEYVLQKPVGKGAMGQVWLAKQESLDRLVAVKVLPKELARDPSFRARFEREAKTAASLIHPNVIQIYSFGIEQGVPYFAMEFVEGEDLSAKLMKGQSFSIREAARITADVAKALECAHQKGTIHRDIKPANVMIARSGTVKVMDFGLAKATGVQSSITQPGLIMGTPTYMSPEQGRGEELDIRSDMYSLGVLLYKMLTGTVPFEADSVTAVIYRHIYESPRPVCQINPIIPEALGRIVMKLLQKNPDDRYRSPTALLADLNAFLNSTTATTRRRVASLAEPTALTEAIGSNSAVPTAVTEPIQAKEASPAAPTVYTAPPAQTYIKTEDEQLEFLEDLLQGDDPGAGARAAKIFQSSPGLRDSYVKQQFIHSLMRSQVDMQDRVGRGKRITRVLAVAGRGEQLVSMPITSLGKALPHAKRPVLHCAVIGAVVMVIAALTLFLLIPGELPEAQAILEMVREKSFDETDRNYWVEMTVYAAGSRQVMTGTMHVRGAHKSLVELSASSGTVVYGTDGETSWLIPPGGPVYLREDRQYLRNSCPEALELPVMSIQDLLAPRGEFVMQVVGDTELPAHQGRELVRVNCTALPGRTDSKIKNASYWIDKETGVVVQAQLELLPGLGGAGHRNVKIEFVQEERRSDYFYKYDKHNPKNWPLFDKLEEGPSDTGTPDGLGVR